jgi:tripartite-type tricarboxylate transporter receptor subunit TctC
MMKRALTLLLLVAGALGQCFAQGFPNRPVTMVVPYAAGGSADVVGRLVAAEMAKSLGQNVVVELRPGAGGNIGAEYVAKSARPDGYTMLLASLSLATNVSLMKLNFDPRKDLAAIGGISNFPNILLVSAKDPAGSLQDLIARARREPGRLTYGSSGPGTSSHLSGELLRVLAGIDIVHVPYKGSGAVYPDLIAGRVTMLFDLMGSAYGHLKGGQVKALATTGARRSPSLPEVPTVAESGFPGFEFGAWLALFAPAEAPRDAVARLEGAMLKALDAPAVKERLAQLGGEPVPARAADFWAYFNKDVERFARLVQEGKIKPMQ